MTADYRLKMRWAKKILTTTSFIVVTDTESVIAIAGLDPAKASSAEVLQAQIREIQRFRGLLNELERTHQTSLQVLKNRSEHDDVHAQGRGKDNGEV